MTTTATSNLPLFNITPSGIPSPSNPRFIKQTLAGSELPTISGAMEKSEQRDRNSVILREQSQIQRLQYFLKYLSQTKQVEHFTATFAWRAWRDIATFASNRLPVPDAGSGPSGEILFSWNNGDHHFELEIFPSGLGEFFYLNYRTDETWEVEYHVGDPIPEEVRNRLDFLLLYAY